MACLYNKTQTWKNTARILYVSNTTANFQHNLGRKSALDTDVLVKVGQLDLW